MPTRQLSLLFFCLSLSAIPCRAVDEPPGIPTDPTTAVNADTLRTPSDTLISDGDLDTSITYSGEHISLTFNPRVTTLEGRASISYREMKLTAEHIVVYWDTHLLEARGVADTTWRDTTGSGADSIVWKGLPRLVDGDQTVDGEIMYYDLKSLRGRVISGETKYEDGTTRGTVIKKVDKNVMNIRSGRYTTCDMDPAHYHFWSRDLKLLVKDKVVARPVVLHFGKVPVAILPFAVFPARGGRHSGLIMPIYGESASQGRFFRNLGYYWAPNDYADAKGTLDYYEKYGLLFRGDMKYVKRYRFNGNLSGSFNNQRREGQNRGYDIVYNHRHALTPSTNLNVRGEYVSNSSYRQDLSQNPLSRMKQTIRSDATLSKGWPGTPYSGSLNLHYDQDLRSGAENRSIPKVGFSRTTSPLIRLKEDVKADSAKWYNTIYYGYRMSGENRSRVTSQVDPSASGEYSISPAVYRSGIKHNLSLSATQKPFGYFALKSSVSYSEAWFDEWLDYTQGNDLIIREVKQDGFIARRTFSGNISLGTKLYGLFRPHIFNLEAIRHTLTPTVSLNYQPDFGEEKWGIYQIFRDSDGQEVFYNRFAGAIYGSPGRGKRMAMGIRIDNLFQYKVKHGDKETKGDILNLGLSTSHNFAKEEQRWGDLTSSLSATPLKSLSEHEGILKSLSGLSMRLNGTHRFYNPAGQSYSGFPRLVRFDLSSSFRLRSSGSGTTRPDTSDLTSDEFEDKAEIELEFEDDRFDQVIWKPSPVPWETGISFHFSERYDPVSGTTRSIWSSLNIELKATEQWKIGYDTRIDLHGRRVVSSNISVYRDLHCWEGRLTWNPSGLGKGYYLIISIKSPQLRDIKVEKSKGVGRIFGR